MKGWSGGSELVSFFDSSSPFKGRFKFKLVVGPGVLDFEPDVTGRDFVFFRFVEAMEDSHPKAGGARFEPSPTSFH